MASTRTPSGGVVSISDGAGSGVTVTINGCGSTVLTAGYGVILETTSTTHTYNFHRLSASTTAITTVSSNISNINAVAANETNINAVNNNSTNINAVANNNANITSVAGNATNINAVAPNVSNISAVNANATNINTVAGNNTNINTVATNAASVSTVATNISSVNNFADRYRVASSSPTSSLDVGDLYFDTTGNELKVYNGSAWQGGVTATGNLVSKSGDQFTGNITFSGSQTVDGRDLSVDGTKLDGIAAGATNYAISSDLLDQDDMVSNSATKVPSQQSVKAYVDNNSLSLIDEDNMATNSATRPPSQQSVKAYADTKAPLASPALTGTATGVNLTLSGDLTVNGTTTTLNSTTVSIDDKNLELGKVSTPTDTTADGGGITLKGGTDKTITWSNSTDTWDFNQGIKIDGGLTVDTNTLHVDATNNRVGIGTTSPGKQVEIRATGPQINLVSDANGISEIQFGDTADVVRGNILYRAGSAGDALCFNAYNNSEAMRIDSAGKVLIGTTTAGHANADDLTIGSTTANSRGGLTINAANDKDGNIHFGDSDSNLSGIISYNHNNNEFLFYTSATLALTLDSSQNATFAGSLEVVDGKQITIQSSSTTASFLSMIDNGAQGYDWKFPDSNTIQLMTSASSTKSLQINNTGSGNFNLNISNGTVSDSKGDLRSIVQNHKTGAYTLIASDAGKMITITTGGVTVNNSIFSAGQAVSIINHSGSDQTITQGSSFTLHNTADATTGNRILAGRGMATMWFSSNNEAYISGAGLS
jgi:hypothetical protein